MTESDAKFSFAELDYIAKRVVRSLQEPDVVEMDIVYGSAGEMSSDSLSLLMTCLSSQFALQGCYVKSIYYDLSKASLDICTFDLRAGGLIGFRYQVKKEDTVLDVVEGSIALCEEANENLVDNYIARKADE